jgi:hypothetical protein
MIRKLNSLIGSSNINGTDNSICNLLKVSSREILVQPLAKEE